MLNEPNYQIAAMKIHLKHIYMSYTQASLILKKLCMSILHNKLQCLVIVVLWILFVLSIIAILNKIGIVDYFLGYSPNANKINEVFYNLSYSYLAGVIFYLVNEWVPRHFRETNARRSLSLEIKQLKMSLDEMHRIIIFISNNKLKQSKGDDETKQDMFSGTIWCKLNGQNVKNIDVKKQLSEEANYVLNILNKIIKSPLFLDLNKSLAKILIDFQSDPFLISAAKKESIDDNANNFEKLFFELETKIYIQTNTDEYCEPSPYECDIEEANKKIKK